MTRSWLCVPASNEVKLAKVATLGADVVVLDLEEAVPEDAKAAARKRACDWLEANDGRQQSTRNFARWVRINGLDTPHWREDLVAVLPGRPDGIVMPKVESTEQLQLLASEIYELEQRNRIEHGAVRIIPQLGETPSGALVIPTLAGNLHPRISGFTWGADSLAASLGATCKKDGAGNWTDALRFVRASVLLLARSKGLMALETAHSDFRDTEGMERAAQSARADGFTGMLAIHPAQVAPINAVFMPSAQQLANARAIVALFEANPGAGALAYKGRMLEKPHLDLARQLLDLA